ncbi:hypothetical protein FG05_13362 [Fusarium graminearum]|nr:hypothetical protein FG05_13362 [Fusarium graminearum]
MKVKEMTGVPQNQRMMPYKLPDIERNGLASGHFVRKKPFGASRSHDRCWRSSETIPEFSSGLQHRFSALAHV